MAIKGLSELLAKHRSGEIDEATFEAELGKALATEWIPKTKFNELNEAKKMVDKALEGANETLKDLQEKAGISEEYKAQIEKLKTENAKAQEEFLAQMTRLKLDTAIENGLKEARARNHKATRALLDESKLTLSEDGSVSGLKDQLEALKAENGFLFDVVEDQSKKQKPSWGGGDKTPDFGGDSLGEQMLAVAGLK